MFKSTIRVGVRAWCACPTEFAEKNANLSTPKKFQFDYHRKSKYSLYSFYIMVIFQYIVQSPFALSLRLVLKALIKLWLFTWS